MPFAPLPELKCHFVRLPSRTAAPDGGEQLVMIHGLATNLAFWYAGLAPALTRFGSVTLYDLRGHGRSDITPTGYAPARLAGDLAMLLDHLGLDRVHLIAHSFGGLVALSFALAHPTRVKSMVLADVRIPCVQRNLVFAEWSFWTRFRDIFQKAGITVDESDPHSGLQLLTALARLQLREAKQARQLGRSILAEFKDVVAHELVSLGGPRSAQRWLTMMETTTAHREVTAGVDFAAADLARLEQPILALVGEYTVARASARALARHCPRCQVGVVRRAGHFFPLSRPRAFLLRTERFLLSQGFAGADRLPLAADD
ncbi:MAG: alpha/beta fold hydrolase [Rhodospirillales bacterium]